MLRLMCIVMICISVIFSNIIYAEDIREYNVKKTASAMKIDGSLDEKSWADAPLTEEFVVYFDGAKTVFPTNAKIICVFSLLYINRCKRISQEMVTSFKSCNIQVPKSGEIITEQSEILRPVFIII